MVCFTFQIAHFCLPIGHFKVNRMKRNKETHTQRSEEWVAERLKTQRQCLRDFFTHFRDTLFEHINSDYSLPKTKSEHTHTRTQTFNDMYITSVLQCDENKRSSLSLGSFAIGFVPLESENSSNWAQCKKCRKKQTAHLDWRKKKLRPICLKCAIKRTLKLKWGR